MFIQPCRFGTCILAYSGEAVIPVCVCVCVCARARAHECVWLCVVLAANKAFSWLTIAGSSATERERAGTLVDLSTALSLQAQDSSSVPLYCC